MLPKRSVGVNCFWKVGLRCSTTGLRHGFPRGMKRTVAPRTRYSPRTSKVLVRWVSSEASTQETARLGKEKRMHESQSATNAWLRFCEGVSREAMISSMTSSLLKRS